MLVNFGKYSSISTTGNLFSLSSQSDNEQVKMIREWTRTLGRLRSVNWIIAGERPSAIRSIFNIGTGCSSGNLFTTYVFILKFLHDHIDQADTKQSEALSSHFVSTFWPLCDFDKVRSRLANTLTSYSYHIALAPLCNSACSCCSDGSVTDCGNCPRKSQGTSLQNKSLESLLLLVPQDTLREATHRRTAVMQYRGSGNICP